MGASLDCGGKQVLSFDSFSAFMSMGGHGLYVWLSYGVGVLVLVLSYVSPILRRKSLIRELAQRQRRELQSGSATANKSESGDVQI